MKKYALLMGDEDGNCIKFLSDGEINDLIQVKEDYGVDNFIESHKSEYPENWSEGDAVLIEYEVKLPKPVSTITRLEI